MLLATCAALFLWAAAMPSMSSVSAAIRIPSAAAVSCVAWPVKRGALTSLDNLATTLSEAICRLRISPMFALSNSNQIHGMVVHKARQHRRHALKELFARNGALCLNITSASNLWCILLVRIVNRHLGVIRILRRMRWLRRSRGSAAFLWCLGALSGRRSPRDPALNVFSSTTLTCSFWALLFFFGPISSSRPCSTLHSAAPTRAAPPTTCAGAGGGGWSRSRRSTRRAAHGKRDDRCRGAQRDASTAPTHGSKGAPQSLATERGSRPEGCMPRRLPPKNIVRSPTKGSRSRFA